MKMILICAAAGIGLAGMVLAGCGREDGNKAEVIATTAIAADVTRVVAGPDADVDQLLAGDASPHGYSASAKDRADLEDAELVVSWGSDLEAGLPLDGLDAFELVQHGDDPHVWMDPTLIAQAVPRLADALAERDPDHADGYRRRAESYAQELLELDARLRRILAIVPRENRKLVSSHDSLGHFAKRYGFDFVGAPFGLTPESEPSAERVADLIDAIERERVPAVFADETADSALMERIAGEANVEVVDDLLVEGFGDRVDGYEEMLIHDAERIAGALGR